MLIVTRNIGQEIVIGDPAKPIGFIRICEVHGGSVRIGVSLPDDIPVHRREVAERIVAEAKREAEAAR